MKLWYRIGWANGKLSAGSAVTDADGEASVVLTSSVYSSNQEEGINFEVTVEAGYECAEATEDVQYLPPDGELTIFLDPETGDRLNYLLADGESEAANTLKLTYEGEKLENRTTNWWFRFWTFENLGEDSPDDVDPDYDEGTEGTGIFPFGNIESSVTTDQDGVATAIYTAGWVGGIIEINAADANVYPIRMQAEEEGEMLAAESVSYITDIMLSWFDRSDTMDGELTLEVEPEIVCLDDHEVSFTATLDPAPDNSVTVAFDPGDGSDSIDVITDDDTAEATYTYSDAEEYTVEASADGYQTVYPDEEPPVVTVFEVKVREEDRPDAVCVDKTVEFEAVVLPEGLEGSYQWQLNTPGGGPPSDPPGPPSDPPGGPSFKAEIDGPDTEKTVNVKGLNHSNNVGDSKIRVSFTPEDSEITCNSDWHKFTVIEVMIEDADGNVFSDGDEDETIICIRCRSHAAMGSTVVYAHFYAVCCP